MEISIIIDGLFKQWGFTKNVLIRNISRDGYSLQMPGMDLWLTFIPSFHANSWIRCPRESQVMLTQSLITAAHRNFVEFKIFDLAEPAALDEIGAWVAQAEAKARLITDITTIRR